MPVERFEDVTAQNQDPWTEPGNAPRDPELAIDLAAIGQADEAGIWRPTKDLAAHKKRAALGP